MILHDIEIAGRCTDGGSFDKLPQLFQEMVHSLSDASPMTGLLNAYMILHKVYNMIINLSVAKILQLGQSVEIINQNRISFKQ